MLLESLQIKQTSLKMTDTQFAARLGISFDMWRSIRYGRRTLSTTILRGILAEFPEFRDEVLFYLGADGTEMHESATIAHTDDLAEVAG